MLVIMVTLTIHKSLLLLMPSSELPSGIMAGFMNKNLWLQCLFYLIMLRIYPDAMVGSLPVPMLLFELVFV